MRLFDEPLSNLDARLRRRVRGEIREIQQTPGLAVVCITHDQEEALAVSDRIIVMDRPVPADTAAARRRPSGHRHGEQGMTLAAISCSACD